MRVAGLISGSSLDGLDIAICTFSDEGGQIDWQLEEHDTVAFSAELSDRLSRVGQLSTRELMETEYLFSRFCAEAVAKVKNTQNIDYISSHGHTALHDPSRGYSLQIGNGGTIAALSGIKCISDYRMTDVALGGQGAPIAPIVERYLFAGHQYYLNLGGIANLSIHSPSGEITSFDTSPCNQILNAEANKLGHEYDAGGAIARSGHIHRPVIDHLMAMDYFQLSGPKSLDNTWVMKTFYPELQQAELSVADSLATMVELVALCIAQHVGHADTPQTMLATGGGAHHSYLIERINHHIAAQNCQVQLPTPAIINMKEAILMALMGYLRATEQPNTIPTVTGATRESCSGAVYLP